MLIIFVTSVAISFKTGFLSGWKRSCSARTLDLRSFSPKAWASFRVFRISAVIVFTSKAPPAAAFRCGRFSLSDSRPRFRAAAAAAPALAARYSASSSLFFRCFT